VTDVANTPTGCDALVDAVVALIRKEVPRVAMSGRNWKVILNGSASGDVRLVVEEHADVVQRFQPVKAN